MDDEIKGKAKGGKKRAEVLTPDRRKEIAKKGASARWAEPVLKATHGSPDHPLKIGNTEIPCYVLEDGTRVLTQYGFYEAIGRSGKPARGRGSSLENIAPFLDLQNLKPFIDNDLINSTKPIKFLIEKGSSAWGYRAEILPKVCEVYLKARDAKALLKSQEKFAVACDLIVRGLAHVGIIALVDEATGYQRDRAKDALAKILEVFIAKELQPWVKTFDADYYQELFRLRGLKYPVDTVQRPLYFGILTNDIVYKRLAPGVLQALKRVIEKNSKGRPKDKLFQKLTNDVGYPKLREHLASVITIMKLSNKYHDFLEKLDRIHPRYNTTLLLPFDDYDVEKDDGKGI